MPRITMRRESVLDNASAKDAAVKTDIPTMNKRRRPSMSAARPPRRRKPPKVSP